MLVTALERERKKAYQKAYREGREEGRTEGVQAQRQTLLQLFQWRFQPSEQEQTQLADELAKVTDLAQLNELVNALLQANSPAEFVTQVATYTIAINA